MSSTLPRVSSMRLTVSGSGGPPVVFVHGWACDATDWRDQIDALEARTTVVAGDLPGHGRSPAGLVECTIAACGAALSAALRELSLPPAILVGHSMGCRVVLEATRVMPDSVCGLVLVDGSRIADGDPEVAVRAMADELVGDGYRRFVRDFFEAMFVPSSDPVLAKSIVDRALRLPAAVGRSLICDGAGWDAREMVNALDAVRVPLLAIQSTALDRQRRRVSLRAGQSSPWLDLVRARVEGAAIEVIPGAGHFPQMERAAEVSALITRFVLS